MDEKTWGKGYPQNIRYPDSCSSFRCLHLPMFMELWILNECVCKSYVCAQSLSHAWLFAMLWTVAHQAPLSMGFPKQEYWSGLPFPSPGNLPNPGIKPNTPASAGRVYTVPSGNLNVKKKKKKIEISFNSLASKPYSNYCLDHHFDKLSALLINATRWQHYLHR